MQGLKKHLLLQNFQALLFDMDGTLVNTEKETEWAIEECLKKQGILQGSLPASQTSGRSWNDIAHTLQQKFSLPLLPKEIQLELEELWEQRIRLHVETTPGAIEFIQKKCSHFPMAIVSSSPRYLIRKILHTTQLEIFFPEDLQIGCEDVIQAKPSPEGYLQAAQKLGVLPSQCLVFEDSLAGLQAAKSANMSTLLVQIYCKNKEECLPFADFVLHDFLTLDQ